MIGSCDEYISSFDCIAHFTSLLHFPVVSYSGFEISSFDLSHRGIFNLLIILLEKYPQYITRSVSTPSYWLNFRDVIPPLCDSELQIQIGVMYYSPSSGNVSEQYWIINLSINVKVLCT